uniref:39S ribosomal protein L35, mitochondrial-like isoform X2 n=1 Tax=Ciona intestinalis TaxID=7719 RepID=UPI000EF51F29|nr:39S ribosomal protein L35, mitochondrial-like isoform X2 [Ciona intestinalis]|eukprot:XP_026691090.1 39S ribosomal protein L35, mitochondrial-like isoform X2 [Ciona intestinalis]
MFTNTLKACWSLSSRTTLRRCIQPEIFSHHVNAPIRTTKLLGSNITNSRHISSITSLTSSFNSLILQGSTTTSFSKVSADNTVHPIFLRNMNRVLPLMNSTPQCRTITRVSQRGGKTKSSKMVLQRFRRLGNGLWIHRQLGYKKKIWKKLLKTRSSAIIWRLRRHVICNQEQSELLDKLVTPFWKKQKWYVDDPYKGYTEESLFYYHPSQLPGNTTNQLRDHDRYAIRRIASGKVLKKQRKSRTEGENRYRRQKPIPNANQLLV